MNKATRNIGIIAHIDAGKTTVSERFLYYSGKEYRMGEVHDGSAHMDWLVEEQERGITITSAATTFEWADCVVNLIDTPGHVDFTAEVERSLRVLDGAIGVFCGVAGVQAQSETVWRQANHYKVPRIAFINKLDRVGADFFRVVDNIAEGLNCRVLPLNIPVGSESEFRAVIDLVTMRQYSFDEESLGAKVVDSEIEAEMVETAELYRLELLEQVADHDESVMEKFIEGEEVDVELLRGAIRAGTIERIWVPVLAGSALGNKGIQPLLDAVIHYLPSPEDVATIEARKPSNGDPVTVTCTEQEPFSALLFKVQIDPHGELLYMRVYSGSLERGKTAMNPRTGKRERINSMHRMHANARENLDRTVAGDIVAVTGPRFSGTGDTLCDAKHQVMLEEPVFPETVISMAVEPRSSNDRDKLQEVLSRIEREDPTFNLEVNRETGQFVMSGMGELHLEVIRNRLERDFKIDANIGKPRVAYRQMVARKGSATVRVERLLGGKEHFGEVKVTLVPFELEEEGFSDIDWVGGKPLIAPEWTQAVEDTVRSCLSGGGDLGFPFIRVQSQIQLSPVTPETTEAGLSMATREAFQGAHEKAGDLLLEPLMAFQVTTPENYFGAIHQDLVRRRAQIEKVDLGQELRKIEGTVPLAEVFGYTTSLRSLSQGRASVSMEPVGFSAAPDEVAERFRY
ncbi:MAG: elongation factor G [Planctomycetota bacterium]|jgi:elongation factor G